MVIIYTTATTDTRLQTEKPDEKTMFSI